MNVLAARGAMASWQVGPPPARSIRWHYNKFFDYPQNYTNFSILTAYGIRRTSWVILFVGLDLGGQPLYSMYQGEWGVLPHEDPRLINPYRIDLVGGAAPKYPGLPFSVDNPFTAAEFERLGPFDRDAGSLPGGCWNWRISPVRRPRSAWLLYRPARSDVASSTCRCRTLRGATPGGNSPCGRCLAT